MTTSGFLPKHLSKETVKLESRLFCSKLSEDKISIFILNFPFARQTIDKLLSCQNSF
jgi:hypothetical protein